MRVRELIKLLHQYDPAGEHEVRIYETGTNRTLILEVVDGVLGHPPAVALYVSDTAAN